MTFDHQQCSNIPRGNLYIEICWWIIHWTLQSDWLWGLCSYFIEVYCVYVYLGRLCSVHDHGSTCTAFWIMKNTIFKIGLISVLSFNVYLGCVYAYLTWLKIWLFGWPRLPVILKHLSGLTLLYILHVHIYDNNWTI